MENTQAQARRVNFNELGHIKSDTSKLSNDLHLYWLLIEEKLDQAQIELRDLNAGLRSLRDEQEYLLQRELTHKQSTIQLSLKMTNIYLVVAQGTNRRVMWWFVFQIGLLGSVAYFQIYYLKRFFEVRRVV